MNDVTRLADTIVPKSDQMNADDLIARPVTVKITAVRRGDSPEQPVSIEVTGHKPYKPCKSMRRVLISAWGDDGRAWVGRSMTLFCDPEVMFGGVKVGGIRISHLSDIQADLQMALTAKKGKRAAYTVRRLTVAEPVAVASYPDALFAETLPKMRAAIASGKTVDAIIKHAEKSGKLTDAQRAAIVEPAESAPINNDEVF